MRTLQLLTNIERGAALVAFRQLFCHDNIGKSLGRRSAVFWSDCVSLLINLGWCKSGFPEEINFTRPAQI